MLCKEITILPVQLMRTILSSIERDSGPIMVSKVFPEDREENINCGKRLQWTLADMTKKYEIL